MERALANAGMDAGASAPMALRGARSASLQAVAALLAPEPAMKRHRNLHWRDSARQETGPMLWQRISWASSVAKALAILRQATAEEVQEAREVGTLGLITPAVRAAAVKGKRGEMELLEFLELALATHGYSPDAPCPLRTAWEVWSPPLVAAAAAGFGRACSLLLAHNADPTAVDSDHDTAVHAAIEQPEVLELLLGYSPVSYGDDQRGAAGVVVPGRDAADGSAAAAGPAAVHRLPFAACATAPNRFHLTPLVLGLTAMPYKPAHRRSLLLLVTKAHVGVSDRDWQVLLARKRVGRLEALALAAAAAPRPPPEPPVQQAALGAAAGRAPLLEPNTASLPNDAVHWHPAWHWSFPASDRAALRLLYEHATRGDARLPPELWRHAFSFVRRGWFAAEQGRGGA